MGCQVHAKTQNMLFFHPERGRPAGSGLCSCLHFLQANAGTAHEIKPHALPFTTFPTHYSPIIISFDVIQPQLLTALLNKQTNKYATCVRHNTRFASHHLEHFCSDITQNTHAYFVNLPPSDNQDIENYFLELTQLLRLRGTITKSDPTLQSLDLLTH
jgi:hypothetical protein